MRQLSDKKAYFLARKILASDFLKGLRYSEVRAILYMATEIAQSHRGLMNPGELLPVPELPDWLAGPPERGKIENDPEVMEFIINFGNSKLVRLHRALVARFGHDRAPSENTLYKFRNKYRRSKPRPCPEAEET